MKWHIHGAYLIPEYNSTLGIIFSGMDPRVCREEDRTLIKPMNDNLQ